MKCAFMVSASLGYARKENRASRRCNHTSYSSAMRIGRPCGRPDIIAWILVYITIVLSVERTATSRFLTALAVANRCNFAASRTRAVVRLLARRQHTAGFLECLLVRLEHGRLSDQTDPFLSQQEISTVNAMQGCELAYRVSALYALKNCGCIYSSRWNDCNSELSYRSTRVCIAAVSVNS